MVLIRTVVFLIHKNRQDVVAINGELFVEAVDCRKEPKGFLLSSVVKLTRYI